MPDFPRAWTEQTITRIRSTSGVTLESLSPQLGDYFGVKNGEGMLVRSVQKGSLAETAGLRAGDVIVKVGDHKITDNADWREALRNNKEGKVSVVIVRDKKEQSLSMAVPVPKGPDSSALYEEPGSDLTIEAAAESLENVEPLIEGLEPLVDDGVLTGMFDLDDVLIDSPEMNRATRKALEQLHRELIENRRSLPDNISGSMKLASAQLKAHGAELRRAMQEAQHAFQGIHLQCESEMH